MLASNKILMNNVKCSLTHEFEEKTQANITLILEHPFIQKLLSNTLDNNKHYNYLLNYEYFLVSIRKGLRNIANRLLTSNKANSILLLTLAEDIQKVKNSIIKSLCYHNKIILDNNINQDLMQQRWQNQKTAEQTFIEYRNYILSLSYDDSIIKFLIAILSIYKFYYKLGCYMKYSMNPQIVYSMFIEGWVQHFTSLQLCDDINDLNLMCDRYMKVTIKLDKEELYQIYRKNLLYHWILFQYHC